GSGRPPDDTRSHYSGESLRGAVRLDLGESRAAGDRRGLHLWSTVLLAALGCVVLGNQSLLLCRLHHGDLLLYGLQYPAGRGGSGQIHHYRGGRQLRADSRIGHRAHPTAFESMIELRNVHKAFGKQVVLNGVDFEVREGETVALLGPSGTGKSVLLKHIIGLIRPDVGEIYVDGKDVCRLNRR